MSILNLLPSKKFPFKSGDVICPIYFKDVVQKRLVWIVLEVLESDIYSQFTSQWKVRVISETGKLFLLFNFNPDLWEKLDP